MIEEVQLDEVVGIVNQEGIGTGAVEKLRTDMPSLHFTYCMDDDVPNAKPVREMETFNVYLVDGRDHCLCFTQSLEHATGLVLAEIEPE